MLTCRQVSRALAKGDYNYLPGWRRALAKFHVSWCGICGGYNKEVMLFHDLTHFYREGGDELAIQEVEGLSDDDKDAMRRMLHAGTSEAKPE